MLFVLVSVVTILTIFGGCIKPMASKKYERYPAKYEWYPTTCADYNYPMQVIEGRFLFPSQGSIYIPDTRILNNGWGEIGQIHLAGEYFKPVPEKMTITWFSYTEDIFYSGTFELPREKMKALFEKGYTDSVNGQKTTYSEIIVGLAPEGDISLWLSGQITIEVASFRAKPAEIEWSRVLDNPDVPREEWIRKILNSKLAEEERSYRQRQNRLHRPWKTAEEIRATGVPHGLWSMYREKFQWELEITGNAKPDRIWINYFNGEKRLIYFQPDKAIDNQSVVPKKFDIYWQTTSGKEYNAVIFFDESEMFQAFKKYKAYNSDEKLKLRIEIGDLSPTVEVALRNSEFILKLVKTKIMIYRI